MKNNFGFIKTAVASPIIKVANPEFNVKEIITSCENAEKNGANLIVFPELSVTGYTCGDLFMQQSLLDACEQAIAKLVKKSEEWEMLCIVGTPIRVKNRLFNCAVSVLNGEIVSVYCKKYLANKNDTYEKRWFDTLGDDEYIETVFCGQEIELGNQIININSGEVKIGIEISEDVCSPIAPSTFEAMAGAHIIVNLAARGAVIGEEKNIKRILEQHSARNICGYLYANAGVYESTTDSVYAGECLVYENGCLICQGERFNRKSQIVYAEIDVSKIEDERLKSSTFNDCAKEYDSQSFIEVDVELEVKQLDKLERKIARNPFVPENKTVCDQICEETFSVQVAGLCKRLEHTNTKKLYIGISGGLDSTLAVLVAKKSFDLLQIPRKDIIGVTMPGFGTTDRTYNNALSIMKGLGITIKEVDIKEACLKHFEDIEHDKDILDVTYENVQARERTQILMDMANKNGGFVLGTGDLSEMALGWCTYNGDHMSMYGVNAGVPKTMIKYLIDWVAENEDDGISVALKDIIATPISPELLPPDSEGKIAQHTESKIGPYELHDFFLYYLMRYGMTIEKIKFLAYSAFDGVYENSVIDSWLKVFCQRFFQQQFKRSCMPDGPKVGLISLSPRSDLKMPSDADPKAWIDKV